MSDQNLPQRVWTNDIGRQSPARIDKLRQAFAANGKTILLSKQCLGTC